MSFWVARQSDVFNIFHKKSKGLHGDVAILNTKCTVDNNKIHFRAIYVRFSKQNIERTELMLINGCKENLEVRGLFGNY